MVKEENSRLAAPYSNTFHWPGKAINMEKEWVELFEHLVLPADWRPQENS